MTVTNTSSPRREYINLNITIPPVRRRPVLPHNLGTRTNYTSWGDDPSHVPSEVLPTKTHLEPSVYKSKTLRATTASQHRLHGAPRGFTRVRTASTVLHASLHLAVYAVVCPARASLSSLHDKGIANAAQELTFYFGSPTTPSVSTPLRLCALRSAIRRAREITSND